MWRQYTCYFPANGSTNPDVFYPKTFPIPRGIIPQNFSLLGFAVLEELGNKQTNKHTNSLTDWRFYREIMIKQGNKIFGKGEFLSITNSGATASICMNSNPFLFFSSYFSPKVSLREFI